MKGLAAASILVTVLLLVLQGNTQFAVQLLLVGALLAAVALVVWAITKSPFAIIPDEEVVLVERPPKE